MKALEAWVARDYNGKIYLHLNKPQYARGQWWSVSYLYLGHTLFTEVKLSDKEPTKVKIVIDK